MLLEDPNECAEVNTLEDVPTERDVRVMEMCLQNGMFMSSKFRLNEFKDVYDMAMWVQSWHRPTGVPYLLSV